MPFDTDATATRAAADRVGAAERIRRPLSVGDLSSIPAAQAAAAVRKEAVWPAPDWRALVAAGMEPRAAALIKLVRDRIPTGPTYGIRQYGRHHAAQERRPDGAVQRDYVHMLSIVRDRLMDCRRSGEVRRARDLILADAGWSQGAAAEAKHLVTSVWRDRLDTLVVDYRDMAKAEAMVREGWPEEAVPAWRRGHTVLADGEGGYLLSKGMRVLEDGFGSEADAWEWLRTICTEASPTTGTARRQPDPLPLPARPRLPGPPARSGLADLRRGADVSPLHLKNAFGLRAVDFGRWVPVPERRAFLNRAHDALLDLADSLDIAPHAIGLRGTLSLAFGTKASGAPGGDYDPAMRAIALPRSTGSGELARCWALALDHWAGDPHALAPAPAPAFASGHTASRGTEPLPATSHLSAEEAAAWMAVHAAIWRTAPMARAEADRLRADIAHREAEAIEAERQRDAWIERSGGAPDAPEAQAYLDGIARWLRARREQVLPSLRASLKAAEARDIEAGASAYAAEARKLCGRDGDFWTRPREMLARAVEATVQDRLAAKGARNDHLVHGAEAERFALGFRGNPYPVGAERERIGDAVLALVDALAPRLNPLAAAKPETVPGPAPR